MSLEGHSIVYFGNDWFGENRTSSHHVARRLGRRLPLLYVSAPGLRAPKATGRDVKKLFRKLGQTLDLPTEIGPHMWHMTMPQVPFRRLPGMDAFNTASGSFLIRRAIAHLGFRDVLAFVLVPHAGPAAAAIGARLLVYYCTDDYAALPGVDKERVTRLDEDLTRRADQVFVTSPKLIESKIPLNPNSVFAPHGVDVELFSKASDPAFEPAPATAALRHPVIGFFGVIGAWIDVPLLNFLAASRPDWTFLFVGMASTDLAGLDRLPNVVMPGPQPYEDLPRWAQAFDVAIIPYILNQQVLMANPLKLREYLATGKPVVSVSTPEIDRFAHCIRLAHNRDEFLAQIEAALEEGAAPRRAERQQAVASMSWDARAEETLRIVEQRLAALGRA
ncbi:MAG: glycosyltransferase [Bryobacteraceae bacterium]